MTELDTTEIVVPYGSDGAVVPEQKYRDNVNLVMTDGRMAYCILGAEGQDKVHYAMPVKNGVYDFMQLAHQVTEAAKSHRKAKDAKNVTEGEFLSGFYKTDRLLPVVTLVVFWGSEEWDGPLLLKDMYTDVDGEIMNYVPDYKVNLLAPSRIPVEELGEFTSSLKEVMTYLKYAKDMDQLDKAVQNDERFRHLERQAVDVINVTTNSGLEYDKGKEEIDVCEAIMKMREISENKGRREGRKQGRKQGRIEGERLLSMLMQELLGADRINDAKLAVEDEEARKGFYREFGILDEEGD